MEMSGLKLSLVIVYTKSIDREPHSHMYEELCPSPETKLMSRGREA